MFLSEKRLYIQILCNIQCQSILKNDFSYLLNNFYDYIIYFIHIFSYISHTCIFIHIFHTYIFIHIFHTYIFHTDICHIYIIEIFHIAISHRYVLYRYFISIFHIDRYHISIFHTYIFLWTSFLHAYIKSNINTDAKPLSL